jgi:hypothetical protein
LPKVAIPRPKARGTGCAPRSEGHRALVLKSNVSDDITDEAFRLDHHRELWDAQQ